MKSNHITTREEFFQFINDNKIKFTPAQQKIIDKLGWGWMLFVKNAHRMNGGEFVWRKPDSEYDYHAGKVYRAFFNIDYAIKRQTGVEVSVGQLFILK